MVQWTWFMLLELHSHHNHQGILSPVEFFPDNINIPSLKNELKFDMQGFVIVVGDHMTVAYGEIKSSSSKNAIMEAKE